MAGQEAGIPEELTGAVPPLISGIPGQRHPQFHGSLIQVDLFIVAPLGDEVTEKVFDLCELKDPSTGETFGFAVRRGSGENIVEL